MTERKRIRRKESWALLKSLHALSTLPWLYVADFNDMLYSSDKKDKLDHLEWLLIGFRDIVVECCLTYIILEGHPYAWERGHEVENRVEERIDRAFTSSSWLHVFPQA